MWKEILKPFSLVLALLNRVLSWADFAVHYTSGYVLYWFFHGLKPQTHTRPGKTKDGRIYAPSVVVTGASEGIGLATALKLASEGYTVFATVKDEGEIGKVKEAVERAPAHMRRTHGSVRVCVMDVLDRSSIARCARHIEAVLDDADQPGNAEREQRPLVGVVNNAGFCMVSPMELTPEADVRRLFELDLWAYVAVIRAFLPLAKKGKARFVNVGSYGGFVNPPLWAPYCAAKAAVEAMTRSWRLELMPFGVGMTTVRPGWTRTAGIGPKIGQAWDGYFDGRDKGGGVAGVDSLGNVIKATEAEESLDGAAEEKVYRPMLEKWYKLTSFAAEGAAEPAEAVAKTVHDALTDRFLMPYYTVGYDALLGQMARDLVPENVYEYSVAKSFGSL